MADRISVKVTCNMKMSYGDGEQCTLSFCPAERSKAVVHADLRMTVNGRVADQFAPGQNYTLELVREAPSDE